MGNYLIRHAGSEQRDDCLWWRPESAGYTAFIDEAGRYAKDEADRICRNRPYVDVPVREEDALALVRRIVRRDHAARGGLPYPPPEPPRPKVPQRCGKCGRMMKHDANPYEPCERCEFDR